MSSLVEFGDVVGILTCTRIHLQDISPGRYVLDAGIFIPNMLADKPTIEQVDHKQRYTVIHHMQLIQQSSTHIIYHI